MSFFAQSLVGGDKRDRTADLLNAIQALSQLSYTPIYHASSAFPPQRKKYDTRKYKRCQSHFKKNFKN